MRTSKRTWWVSSWSRVSALALVLGGCSSPAELPYGADHDHDGWPADFDCDDDDPATFPAADDKPGDGIDQDCSGSDAESVGGAPSCEGEACGPGSGGSGSVELDNDGDGFTNASGDCNDDDPTVHPAAHDIVGDGIDQDCSGSDSSDFDQDGFDGGDDGDDCDDEDPSIHPGRLEIVLDGIDQNCDGSDLPGFGEPQGVLSDDAQPAEPPDLAVGQDLEGHDVILAVWADSRVSPRQDLYGQLLDATGIPLGAEIPVDTADNHAKSSVRVASRGDGFLVTWATSEGVWVRQLDRDGNPSSIVFGYGDVGGAEPRPAFGGGNWAVAWTVPATSSAFMRAMTTDDVRGDIVNVGGSSVGSLALAGSNDGFLVAWDGTLAVSSGNGISAQLRSAIGEPLGQAFDVARGAGGPAALAASEGFAVAFRVNGGLGYAAAQRVSAAGDVIDSGQFLRLSSESNAQSNFRLAGRGGQLFSAWEDFRHTGGPLSANAIYGNAWKIDEPVHWSAGAGLVAGSLARLGGIAVLKDRIWFSVQVASGVGLLRLDDF